MVPRYGISIGIGAAITFALLFLMQQLIANDRGVAREPRDFLMLDFVRVEREEVIETARDKPEKPPEPAEQPEVPRTTNLDPFQGPAVSVTPPQLDNRFSTTLAGFAADGDHMPFAKVTPLYPHRAREQGIEGYAIVEYTVTEMGTTTDIRLVESTHSIFERSCIDAAARFKYRPRVVNGEAIAVPGVQNRCTFELSR